MARSFMQHQVQPICKNAVRFTARNSFENCRKLEIRLARSRRVKEALVGCRRFTTHLAGSSLAVATSHRSQRCDQARVDFRRATRDMLARPVSTKHTTRLGTRRAISKLTIIRNLTFTIRADKCSRQSGTLRPPAACDQPGHRMSGRPPISKRLRDFLG